MALGAAKGEAVRDGHELDIIIVDDSDGKVQYSDYFDVYDYARQKEAMGDDLYALFERFHKSSACKQFGLWLAYKREYDVCIVIDSDCIVPEGFVNAHLKALAVPGMGWQNPLNGSGWFSRGFPYSKREMPKWAHMGLWENELDLYGTDRVGKGDTIPKKPQMHYGINPAQVFPLSGMNVSFVREAIPYMLFLPNFQTDNNQLFTRHDDIWGGYIFEKIAAAKNKALSFGAPIVFHDTIVVPEEDAAAEVPMISHEDEFYAFIDHAMVFTGAGARNQTASEMFFWLSHEVIGSETFHPLRHAFEFQAKAYA